MKHIYKEFVNLIESYDVAFDTNDQSNLAQKLPVIGM